MKKIIKETFNFKQKISVIVLSLIYSLLLIFGNSYKRVGNASLVFNDLPLNLLIFILIFIVSRFLLIILYNILDKNNNKKLTTSKLEQILNTHPFLFSFIVIIVLWLPYIISFYPIILSPDPSYQIKQFFKIPNKYMDYSIMIDKNVTITAHHPVIHTLLLGGCLKLGTLINNDNLGLFIYSIIQILILSSVLSYTIKYMTKINVDYKYRFICILIYSLVPMFPMYAMSGVKDTIFTSLIILYDIFIYQMIKDKNYKLNTKNTILIILLLIFIILFRNNGFHIVLLSFPWLFSINKTNVKQLIIIFIVFISFNFSYNKIILPYFKITPTSIREVLSIPFQQTARYVKYNDLTSDEYLIYDKVLDMSDLAVRYNPELSDPVKNKYNKYTTNKELSLYFKTWYKDLKKDPIVYIDATINNTYGYFYPFKSNWYVHHKFDKRIVEDGFNYHYNNLKQSRKVLSKLTNIFPYIPIIGLISNIGFNTWILFFLVSYLIYKKKYSGIIYLTPSLIALLVCVASPANTYFRYAMPYIFAMPLLIGMFIKLRSEQNEKK